MPLRPRFSGFGLAAALSVVAVSAQAQPAPPAPAPEGTAAAADAAPADGVGPTVEPDGEIQEGPPSIQQGTPAPRRPAAAAPKAGAPPASPWKPLFFDNDFSAYVGKPPYVLGEELKLMPVAEDITLSVGGQVRHRVHSEDNRLVPGGPGYNSYQLWRNRAYADLKTEYARFYVEGIDATQFGEDLPQTAIDQNRTDLQNAFVDLYLFNDDDYGKGTFRYGRQELLYGDQHLISPLDWGNTRRNFEGYKYFHQVDDVRLDLFSVNPVNSAADFPRRSATEQDNSFDSPLNQIRFSGAYVTYTGIENMTAEAFYLYTDDDAPRANFADGNRSTLGGRFAGTVPVEAGKKVLRTWDYDLFGAYQFGADNGQSVQAGAVNAVAGHTWNAATWSPRIAGLFYYGSGDDDPNDGTNGTFNTLFPLGHAYWGIIDNLSGQNLFDYSIQGSVKPNAKTTLIGQYHYFDKVSQNDFLYNVAKAPLGPQTSNDKHIGQEFDFIATYAVNPNLELQTGYAYFTYGAFVNNNLPRDDANFFYFQTTFNY